MSWKIYNAFKYKGSWASLLKDIETIKKIHRKESVNDGVAAFASYFTPKGIQEISPLVVYEEVWAVNRIGPHRIPKYPIMSWELDVRGQIVVFVRPSGLYVQFFAHNKAVEWADKNPRFKDWHWQNSTDRPDDVSGREWGERERFWKKLFAGSGVPSEEGFSMELSTWTATNDMIDRIVKELWPKGYKEPEKEKTAEKEETSKK